MNKGLKELKVFCDGGARGNPGPAAIGFVVKNQMSEIIYQHGEMIGEATNNTAEYQAVIYALRWLGGFLLAKKSVVKVGFYLDSQLVVNQLNGHFKIKKPHLRKLFNKLKCLEGEFKAKLYYYYIPRKENSEPDRLLNQALDKLML